ncbi:MAG: helix-turn-helix transcriptional regulator [Bacteroidales bacterium]|nr:helix-turn-helix transcriptional regulator [Bacteroidales bacterium]
MKVGKLIQLRRKELNMTQEELALAAGTTKSAICHYEAGRREPRLIQLQAIARVLGLSVHDLADGPDEPRIVYEYIPGEGTVPDEVPWTEEEYFEEKLRGRKAGIEDVYYQEIASLWAKLSIDGRREAAKRVRELTRLEEYQASPERAEGADALGEHNAPF